MNNRVVSPHGTTVRAVVRGLAVALVVALLAAACGGGSSSSSSDDFIDLTQESTTGGSASSGDSGGSDTSGDSGSGAEAAPIGPITGLLTSQPSFESALWAIDAETGDAIEMPIDGADRVTVQDQPIAVGDIAFTLGVTVREGQSWANDVSLVRIDRSAGTATAIAELGFDLENDDASDRTDYTLLAATSSQVLIEIGMFGEDSTIHVLDAVTGAEVGSFAEPFYEFQGDSSSCSGGVTNYTGLADGSFAATTVGSVATLDASTGEVAPLINCDVPEPNLADLIDVADPNATSSFVLFRDTDAPTDDDVARLLDLDLEPGSGFIEGDGDLWWINAQNRTFDAARGVATAVVRFDPATATVEQVYGLGSSAASFDECADDGDSCDLKQLNQADLAFVGGKLVIIGNSESSPVIVLDPATGAVTETVIDAAGVDYTNADLLAHDDSQVWIEVDRMTITKDDDTGRSASGPTFFEVFDPATGTVTASLAGEDLFF